MKKIAATLMAAGLIFGLASCSNVVSVQDNESGIVVKTDEGEGSVKIVQVPDGASSVKCAVLIGYSKGGISCDWSAK